MSNKLRLLVLTHNYPRYDGDHSGVFLTLLMRRLGDHGIEPVVLAPHDEGAAEFEKVDGVEIHRFRYADDKDETLAYRGNMHDLVLGSVRGMMRFRKFLKSFEKAALSLVKNERFDVIAGHWLVPTGLVMKGIARKAGLPMIMSSHGTDIRMMRKFHGFPYTYLKGFCRNLKSWTTVSSMLRDSALNLDQGLDPQRIKIVPLPHDESIFYEDPEIKRNDKLVAAVTRFTEQKRVECLIDAFARVTLKFPTARLEIYGSGPRQEQIERLIIAHGLDDQVEIFAPVPQEDLRKVYNRASVVVLNSYREGFGLALSEAMLCGAAVIGTDSGGITDIIEHEKRGLLARLDDSRHLASSIVRLLGDRELRLELAANGTAFAQNEYGSERLAGRYAEIVRAAAAS